jgi:hypothetical protein
MLRHPQPPSVSPRLNHGPPPGESANRD